VASRVAALIPGETGNDPFKAFGQMAMSNSDSMVGSAIGSILVADLAAVAGDRYNYGVNLTPVNVFIDEAAEVVNDPFIQLLNKGRGADLRLTVATQTFADFAARTGSEAKARQVLGNINTWWRCACWTPRPSSTSPTACPRPA
jgi:hypothetical protein